MNNTATFIYQSLFFFVDLFTFQIKNHDKRFSPTLLDLYPCLLDKTSDTPYEPHYLYHPAWAMRALAKLKPKKHIDISSTVTFCSLASAFLPVEFYDIRPANIKLSNLTCKHGDLMNLPFKTGSVESISCMHTIEHIGLGRYGDPIDPDGDLKAISELIRVTKSGGTILFVTPVGKKTLRFNAHRIYFYDDVISYFQKDCRLREFTLIPDTIYKDGMLKNPPKKLVDQQNWGCGCFWFIKK